MSRYWRTDWYAILYEYELTTEVDTKEIRHDDAIITVGPASALFIPSIIILQMEATCKPLKSGGTDGAYAGPEFSSN